MGLICALYIYEAWSTFGIPRSGTVSDSLVVLGTLFHILGCLDQIQYAVRCLVLLQLLLSYFTIHAMPAPFSMEMEKWKMKVSKGRGVGGRIGRRGGKEICSQYVKLKINK